MGGLGLVDLVALQPLTFVAQFTKPSPDLEYPPGAPLPHRLRWQTHLATALGIAACQRGKRVRFCRVAELITQLMGYVPASKLGAELLFEVISSAYERQSLIVTTNLPFEQWTEVLGSERLTGAELDRLTHRWHILESTGESYRLQDARRRRKGSRPKPLTSSSSPADESTES